MSDYTNILQGKDAISSKMGKAFITIGDQRYHAINLINCEFKFEKNKVEVPRLGAAAVAHKSVGWSGTFSMSFHFVSSVFPLLLERYKDTGEDVYFTAQITIDDPTSDAGEYTVIFENCNLDGGLLMKLDAEGDLLTDEQDGTFDNFRIVKAFDTLPGMV